MGKSANIGSYVTFETIVANRQCGEKGGNEGENKGDYATWDIPGEDLPSGGVWKEGSSPGVLSTRTDGEQGTQAETSVDAWPADAMEKVEKGDNLGVTLNRLQKVLEALQPLLELDKRLKEVEEKLSQLQESQAAGEEGSAELPQAESPDEEVDTIVGGKNFVRELITKNLKKTANEAGITLEGKDLEALAAALHQVELDIPTDMGAKIRQQVHKALAEGIPPQKIVEWLREIPETKKVPPFPQEKPSAESKGSGGEIGFRKVTNKLLELLEDRGVSDAADVRPTATLLTAYMRAKGIKEFPKSLEEIADLLQRAISWFDSQKRTELRRYVEQINERYTDPEDKVAALAGLVNFALEYGWGKQKEQADREFPSYLFTPLTESGLLRFLNRRRPRLKLFKFLEFVKRSPVDFKAAFTLMRMAEEKVESLLRRGGKIRKWALIFERNALIYVLSESFIETVWYMEQKGHKMLRMLGIDTSKSPPFEQFLERLVDEKNILRLNSYGLYLEFWKYIRRLSLLVRPLKRLERAIDVVKKTMASLEEGEQV